MYDRSAVYQVIDSIEQKPVDHRRAIESVICRALKWEYDHVLWIADPRPPDVPTGEPDKSPSDKGVEDPRQPGDELDDAVEAIWAASRARMCTRKLELLSEGLNWGCDWAEQELLRIGGSLEKTRPD